MAIAVKPRHPALGAEIRGVDMTKPVDAETIKQVHDAWMKHLVVVFPDHNTGALSIGNYSSNSSLEYTSRKVRDLIAPLLGMKITAYSLGVKILHGIKAAGCATDDQGCIGAALKRVISVL